MLHALHLEHALPDRPAAWPCAALGQKVDGADTPCAAGPAEPEEEGGSVPLVEVHRTPSTGSWLGMVRRRIAGSAGEDGEGSGAMVREFSLPKQRRSGQGGTLKVRPAPASLLSPVS